MPTTVSSGRLGVSERTESEQDVACMHKLVNAGDFSRAAAAEWESS